MPRFFPSLLLTSLTLVTALGACEMAPTPDYRIRMVPSADGKQTLALPPECMNWQTVANAPIQNSVMPQLGCAHMRNLAAQVERPSDLDAPKPLGPADATVAAQAVNNYRAGKSEALMDAKAEAPTTQAATGSNASN